MIELNVDPNALSSAELHERTQARRFEVFDQICERYRMTPYRLARQGPEQLQQLVKAIIGDEKEVSGIDVSNQIDQWRRVRQADELIQ